MGGRLTEMGDRYLGDSYRDAYRELLGGGVATARNVLTGDEVDLPSRGSIVRVEYDTILVTGMGVEDSTWGKGSVTGLVRGYDVDVDRLSSRQAHGMCWYVVMEVLTTNGQKASIPCPHVTAIRHDPTIPSPVREVLSFIHGEDKRRLLLYQRIRDLVNESRDIKAEMGRRDAIVRRLCEILASGPDLTEGGGENEGLRRTA